jgi:hypothetical protein
MTSTGGNLTPTAGIGSSFEALAEAAALLARSEIHSMMPATVTAYHAPTGIAPNRKPAMVDVTIDFLTRRDVNVAEDASEDETALERATGWQAVGPYPPLVNCPVLYPGPDGMRSSGPIKVGASGWVFFVERSIDDWIQTGGPVDPAFDYQWHHLSDAIFVPGARYGSIAEDIAGDVYRIGSADGGAGMEISTSDPDVAAARTITLRTDGPTATVDAATEVKLGEGATLGAARLTDPVAPTGDMTTFMAAVVTALNLIAAAPGPVVIVPPIPPGTIGTISGASSKVKAE